jgi:hypothetical protein
MLTPTDLALSLYLVLHHIRKKITLTRSKHINVHVVVRTYCVRNGYDRNGGGDGNDNEKKIKTFGKIVAVS